MSLQTGLLILHGNRLEWLADAVFDWLGRQPLAPLEEETFLVHSNGMAEWLKMAIAAQRGICAATRVELPARFIWRAYRAVLGRAQVPPVSALDKLPLTWRLMRLLPSLSQQPGFEPVAGFLGAGRHDPSRRLQLAQRLADLFDQYQAYRADWLLDWSAGRDVLSSGASVRVVPPDQRWQPALWRAALADLDDADRAAIRPELHQRFLNALQSDAALDPALPRRLVLFGATHMPHQTLDAIAALSKRCQVLMAVPNPSRYHWADIIDGRELLRAARRRHPLRGDVDLAAVPLQDMHRHGHPLLASWGRQGRDFLRQLDAFDDVQLARQRFAVPRVDLFDDEPGTTWLQQVQARIRDLVPMAEHEATPLAASDRSIVFQIAHSAQREVEILHDQLLRLFAEPPGARPLNPRDVVVMVPDIAGFAPAIRSVFGSHGRGHPRHIPWGIADLGERGHQPLLVAVEWLMRASRQRFGFSELRDLLDVPAVQRKLGLALDELQTLGGWVAGSGVRWGLHNAQRSSLGLQDCGDLNTWHFGLKRMLMGYATGELDDGPRTDDPPASKPSADIEPYPEVAGLSAGLAGVLAELLDILDDWWLDIARPRTPSLWAERLRRLLGDVFEAANDGERSALALLDDALGDWLQACEAARFDAPLDADAVREAWLEGVDAPGIARRFKAGGVTFCTLLPLRAIPFEVVCLLGMNDGDYPRRGVRSDFDLMALPGMARPGDRSRRHDDRQLMLDALLSARRVLYISWAGRSVRDNEEQPPSVLVAQLRDHLGAGWGTAAVDQRTTRHPLQPFSRRYFEQAQRGEAALPNGDDDVFTYAREWRAAHETPEAGDAGLSRWPMASWRAEDAAMTLDFSRLAAFLRNPVRAFFDHRLQVRFHNPDPVAEDDEAFAVDGLSRWGLLDELLRRMAPALQPGGVLFDATPARLRPAVEAQVARLRHAGRLPLAGPGRRTERTLSDILLPMLAQWQALRRGHAEPVDTIALRWPHPHDAGLVLTGELSGLTPAAAAGDLPCWMALRPGVVADARLKPRHHGILLDAWVRSLAAAASGWELGGLIVASDAWVRLDPLQAGPAAETLAALLIACRWGLTADAPTPTAVSTGLAWLRAPDKARAVFEGSGGRLHGEGREPCLARLFPDFETLSAEPDFPDASALLYRPYLDWLDSAVHIQALPDAAHLDDDGEDRDDD